MDALTAYEQTLVWTGQRIAGIRPEDLTSATPCSEWNVRALVAHIVAGIWYFQALATGEPVEELMQGLTDLVGDDPFASYDRAGRAGLEAWRAPGRLDATYTMPLGERTGREALSIHQADLLIHGWDVAEATHQDSTIDNDLARFALDTEHAFIEGMGGRGRVYAEALTVPTAATDQERLLAFVGRSAAWR